MSRPRPLSDWHGLERVWVREADGRASRRLLELVDPSTELDPMGLRAALGLRAPSPRSVFAGVRLRDAPHSPRPSTEAPLSAHAFETALRLATSRMATLPAPMLAVGGGLDSAVVAALLRSVLGRTLRLVTLRTGIADYDELDGATALARHLDLDREVVATTPRDLVGLAGTAVAVCGCPFWNLHPVGRLALARGVAALGAGTLITGDGADPLFRGVPDDDYVPLVVALSRAAGLRAASPFFDVDLVETVLSSPADPDKQLLRRLAEDLGLPPSLRAGPKRARLLPELPIAIPKTRADSVEHELLSLGIHLGARRAHTGSQTLGLLLDQARGAA